MNVWCDWLVLCSKVIQDSQSQNLTLVNCLEQISAFKLPTKHSGFGFGALLRTDTPPAENIPVEVRFVRLGEEDEDDEVVIGFTGEWGGGSRRARVLMNFPFLRLYKPGPIRFRLDFKVGEEDWEQGRAVSVDVVKLELPPEKAKALEEAHNKLEQELQGRGAMEKDHAEDVPPEDDK